MRAALLPTGLLIGFACSAALAAPPVDETATSLQEAATIQGTEPDASIAPAPRAPDCSALRPAVRTDARYPLRALSVLREGWEEMAFDLTPAGEPHNIRVLAAQPAGLFEDAAVEALARWSYDANPGLRDCREKIRFEID